MEIEARWYGGLEGEKVLSRITLQSWKSKPIITNTEGRFNSLYLIIEDEWRIFETLNEIADETWHHSEYYPYFRMITTGENELVFARMLENYHLLRKAALTAASELKKTRKVIGNKKFQDIRRKLDLAVIEASSLVLLG